MHEDITTPQKHYVSSKILKSDGKMLLVQILRQHISPVFRMFHQGR